MISVKKFRLSRRAMLRGAFGTAVALPTLECMLNSNGTAFAGGASLPKRYFLFHVPTSLVTSNDTDEQLTPNVAGFNYDTPSVLQPFNDHGVKGDISVVSGLFAPPLNAPGGYDVDYHGQAPFAVLTGKRAGFSGEYWRPPGYSADQIAVQRLAPTTTFPFLYWQIDPQTGGMRIVYEPEGGSDDTFYWVEPQTSPALAYGQLFTGFSPPGDEPDPQAELEKRLRLSSLSYVKDDLAALQKRLGSKDKQTLEQHLEHVRDLEKRLDTPVGVVSPACNDPALGGDPADISSNLPDQDGRAELFVQLSALAFACDMTRVITLSGSSFMTGAGMRHQAWNSIGGLHNEVQHHASQNDLDNANRWFVDVFSRLVARLKDTPEGEGNVLDNTAALYMMEGGKGLADDPQRSGDGGSDANHSVDNFVAFIAGRAGGLNPGQHVNLTGEDLHPSKMITSAFQAIGIEPTLGEISGAIDQLFG
jgi:hypothetical protein